ncbi:hypothetical protein OG494_31640 [Amycolatopsis sp. NBC_00438]
MRVDQVGYALGEAKHAYLLGGAQGTFTVVDDCGRTVRQGRIGASLGAWNDRYKTVFDLDLSTVDLPGHGRGGDVAAVPDRHRATPGPQTLAPGRPPGHRLRRAEVRR